MNWNEVAGVIVRERRTALGLTQRDVAQLAGISQAEVARIETHRSQPTVPTLGRILDALGVEIVPKEVNDVRPTIADEVAEDVAGLLRGAAGSSPDLSECFRSASTIVDAAQRWPRLAFLRATAKPPRSTGSRQFDALIAALVEDCCRQDGVEPPDWVDDEHRFVEGEWYTSGIDSLHELARQETPPSFRRHGIYAVPGEFSRA